MKIQLNGFDIEINTDDENMTIMVMDAEGNELSNNSYSQENTTEPAVEETDMEDVSDNESESDDDMEDVSDDTTEETEDEDEMEFESFQAFKAYREKKSK